MSDNQKQLHRSLVDRIRQHGSITVAEYMAAVSQAYYAFKNPFGAEGDFVTAPEVSQMFGEMVAAWLVDCWMQMGRPDDIRLVELGPGRGTLAADIMRTIAAWPDFKSAVTLHLVETSPRLREIQADTLKHYAAGWHDSFSSVPEGPCLIVANEFFDALPIHQFVKQDGAWAERCVGYDPEKQSFYFTTAYPHPNPLALGEGRGEDIAGAIFETSPLSLTILREISHRIARQGGAALIIDYGHDRPGFGDTLQALSKHQYADPLQNPGERDITAHVDFSAFKAAAGQTVAVTGPVTQGQFLIALGIEARAQSLCATAPDPQRQQITRDLCRLVAPQEMGRLFKIMALTPKDATIVPAGFGMQGNEITDD